MAAPPVGMSGSAGKGRLMALLLAGTILSVMVPGTSTPAVAAGAGSNTLPMTDGNGRLLTPATPEAPTLYERGANAAATVRDITGWAIGGAVSAAGSAASAAGSAVSGIGGYFWSGEESKPPRSDRYSEPSPAPLPKPPKPVSIDRLRDSKAVDPAMMARQELLRTETIVPHQPPVNDLAAPDLAAPDLATHDPAEPVVAEPVVSEPAVAEPVVTDPAVQEQPVLVEEQGKTDGAAEPVEVPVASPARRPLEPMAPRGAAPEPELTLRTAMVEGVGIVGEPAQRLPDGTLFVPKPAQRMMVVRTQQTQMGDVPDTRELMGRVIPDPSHSGRVMAVQSGRVHVGPAGMPFLGQSVEKGEVLGYIEPVLPVSERTALLNELALVSTALKTAKERLVRTETFFFVPFREGKVRLAEIEIEGLRKRYAVLSSMISRREELRAPSSGVISAVNVVAGQVVDPNVALFEIINPNRLWVEAVAFDASIGENVAEATASTLDQRALNLRFIGSGRSLRQQSVPMQFELLDPPKDLQEGQPVRLYVAGPVKNTGLMVPRRAVVRADNGEPVVFERTAPEKFEPRRVVVDPVDAERVVVRSGLQAGVPVVVNGAQLMSQVR